MLRVLQKAGDGEQTCHLLNWFILLLQAFVNQWEAKQRRPVDSLSSMQVTLCFVSNDNNNNNDNDNDNDNNNNNNNNNTFIALISNSPKARYIRSETKKSKTKLQTVELYHKNDRGLSLERNCVLRQWESETLK